MKIAAPTTIPPPMMPLITGQLTSTSGGGEEPEVGSEEVVAAISADGDGDDEADGDGELVVALTVLLIQVAGINWAILSLIE